MKNFLFIVITIFLISCSDSKKQNKPEPILLQNYFNYGDSIESAGIKMIPIKTPVGNFKVWTKRFGSNPKIKNTLITWRPSYDARIHGML